MLRRRFLTLVSLFVLAVATSTPYTLRAQNAVTTAIGAAAAGYAIVILSAPPLAAWPGTARTANGKIDFASGANARYQAALAQARNAFKQWLRSTRSPAQVLREYDTVLHGLAVRLDGATLDSLRAGPGVTIVEPSLLRSEEHTSELQSRFDLVCRLLLEKKKNNNEDKSIEHHPPLAQRTANLYSP